MDKNPARFEKGANVLLCHDAFAKQWAASRVAGRPGAHYLDIDMLYSGYVRAGVLKGRAELPEPGRLREALARAVEAAARGRTVVLDSLNGLCLAMGPGSGMYAESYTALLSCAARASGAEAFVMAVAREAGGAWVLRPGGARVPEPGALFFVDAARRVGKLGGPAGRL